MKRRCVIDEGIGETRAAVYEGRHLVELYVRRWSDAARPRFKDRFIAKVSKVEAEMAAAFVDLGNDYQGFLKFTDAKNAPRFHEGQYIEVRVTREAEPGKHAHVQYISQTDTGKPGAISQLTLRDMISQRFSADLEFEYAPVSSLIDAVETEIALPGGGDIAIETTRAMIAIDVDRGRARSGYEVSLEACTLIARQIRLRGLGGLIAIDIPNLRQKRQRDDIPARMSDAVEADPNTIKIAPLSRFGVLEMTRQKTMRSLDDVLLDGQGQFTTETQAMQALAMLEREGRHSAGAQLTLTVPETVYTWLDETDIGWKDAMRDRLGARFQLEKGSAMTVKADR